MLHITCTLCNHKVPTEDILEFAEHLLCPDCVTRYTTECQCCGERIWSADNAGSHSFPLCQDCYDRHYTHCSSCGCVLHAGDAYYIDDDDEPYLDVRGFRMINAFDISTLCHMSRLDRNYRGSLKPLFQLENLMENEEDDFDEDEDDFEDDDFDWCDDEE